MYIYKSRGQPRPAAQPRAAKHAANSADSGAANWAAKMAANYVRCHSALRQPDGSQISLAAKICGAMLQILWSKS